MALTPYEPFRHLDNVRRELDHFFSNGLETFKSGIRFGNISIDIHETDDEVVATCDIPGLEKKEDLQIDVDHNMLTIAGQINRVDEVKEENMHRKERFSGKFQRSATLPANVSSDNVRAKYKNGVLEVRMQKQNQRPNSHIDIEFH